uniref:Macaca fascicularis brain cDNA, clone: QtrA-16161 n=1 Tax=Macaca fascicularis TaxID=9541 RepID=I7G9C3_MACFA|nr:unnamed protein product [Macaca fascicularis]
MPRLISTDFNYVSATNCSNSSPSYLQHVKLISLALKNLYYSFMYLPPRLLPL